MNLLALVLVAVSLAPQTLPAQTPPPGQPPANRYTLGPQDQVKVTVLEDPDFNNNSSYVLDSDGFISLPYLNRVAAAGLTIGELQDRIRLMLVDGHFIRSPSVRVELEKAKSQSVIVSGEVRAPGEVPMSGNMTLLKALAIAGSPMPSASSELTIAHRPKAGTVSGDKDSEPFRVNWKDISIGKSSDIALQDGDLINVPKAQTFYITGQVRQSGSLIWEPGLTIQQAIILAGGLTERGSDRGIRATRLVNGKPKDVKVNLEDKVLANDVIRIGSRIF